MFIGSFHLYKSYVYVEELWDYLVSLVQNPAKKTLTNV